MNGRNFVGLNVLVGRMGADDVLNLADLAEEYGSGEVRLSQRQNVIVTDVPDDALDDFRDEPLLDHYSPDPSPFMRGSVACTGTEFCSLSIVETKNRQVRFARWLKVNVDLPADVDEFHIHLSGCTASCAQPQIADVSLRGMKTRKDGDPVEALDVGLGGGLGENPQFARWVTQRVPVDEVPGAIANLIDSFAAERDEGESFRAFVARHDDDELDAFVEPEDRLRGPDDAQHEAHLVPVRRERYDGGRAADAGGRLTMSDRLLRVNAYTTLDLVEAAPAGTSSRPTRPAS